jgi:hypothetical protein
MNLTEAFTLRVAIPEPVDYGGNPWGPRIFVGAGVGRVEGDRLWFRDVRLAELAAVHRRGPLPGGGHDRIPHLRGRIAEPSNQRATAHCTRTIERAN